MMNNLVGPQESHGPKVKTCINDFSKEPYKWFYLRIYPPGSKSEALRLGVHLILLYFIRISLLTPKTFYVFGCDVDVYVGVGVDGGLFFLICVVNVKI